VTDEWQATGGRRRLAAAAALAALIGAGMIASEGGSDPFAFLAPTIELTRDHRAALDAGRAIARALPSDDGHLAIFAAARLDAGPEALMAWTEAIEALHRGVLVRAIGRFSVPPVESDLAALRLSDVDLEALQQCRPGACKVKLAAAEIVAVQQAIRAAGHEWRGAAERAFKQVLLARVRDHRDHGLTALPAYADRERPASIYEVFAGIVTRSPYLAARLPTLAVALETPALAQIPASASFYYWSTEDFGTGKPVTSVSHVRYWMPASGYAPGAVSASTQIFASHYMNGALSLTMVLCEPDGAPCYLAYVNRTHTDVFGGLFGGLRRSIARQRLETQAPRLIAALRDRLQTPPPVR
jgi:hypothetical protein